MLKPFYIIILCLMMGYSADAYEKFNHVTRYDPYFSKYSKRFFGPGFDWNYFKAQAIAESHLNANAKSHVGAEGIMQIMPLTYHEIQKKYSDLRGPSKQPRWNIAAGIYYDRTIWKLFKAERPFKDRLYFMFGAYNAGKGNIIKAQKKATEKGLNPNLWDSIKKTLQNVTGDFSHETLNYVDKIQNIKEVLK